MSDYTACSMSEQMKVNRDINYNLNVSKIALCPTSCPGTSAMISAFIKFNNILTLSLLVLDKNVAFFPFKTPFLMTSLSPFWNSCLVTFCLTISL